MAIKIGNGQQTITGDEPYWGDVKFSSGQLDLINKSPTLQRQLQDYGSQEEAGKVQPMKYGDEGGTYFDGHRIVIGTERKGQSDDITVGTLSHEIGHFENQKNDRDFKARYPINPHDPNAYNISALQGAHAEGGAMYNNWQVQQEILGNTTGAGEPGHSIYFAASPSTQQQFDDRHAADVKAGLSSEQDRNRLIRTGMDDVANDNPSTAPDETYYQFYGAYNSAGVPEVGGPPKVTFGADANGNIDSMTEKWPSGDIGMQSFADGKIQDSKMVDKGGNLLSSTSYQWSANGSYSAKVTDQQGRTIEDDKFNADNSGISNRYDWDNSMTSHQYNSDNSEAATSFDSKGRKTETVNYDANGQYVNGEGFNPDTGQVTSQGKRTSDDGYSFVSYDAKGNASEQDDYDQHGKIVRQDAFEDGRNTRDTRYNLDGSRTETTFNKDGAQTVQSFDSKGELVPDGNPPTQPAGNPVSAGDMQQASGGQSGGAQQGAGYEAAGSQQQPVEAAPAAYAQRATDNMIPAAAANGQATSAMTGHGSRQDADGVSGVDAGDSTGQTANDASGVESAHASVVEDNIQQDATGAPGADVGDSTAQSAKGAPGDDSQQSLNGASNGDGQQNASDT
ncbi:hypothetical protein [Paraburkholderia sacchari]|uniref:hypothetical protein n=1 Tax=Paraburkholderia sacchari TaxID=159450 RepID=UPI001BCB9149|nr:hypothetical protein [Paraburkholderia sacchari]